MSIVGVNINLIIVVLTGFAQKNGGNKKMEGSHGLRTVTCVFDDELGESSIKE